MPGRLRCHALDVSAPEVLRRVLQAIDELIAEPGSKAPLELRGRYHFRVRGLSLPTSPGWYVICGPDQSPLYVGTAEDLDARLNTDNGSRDGFANPKRTSDPERNFIKALLASGTLANASVVFFTEMALREKLGLPVPLEKLDRENIEKIINIFRANLFGLASTRVEHKHA